MGLIPSRPSSAPRAIQCALVWLALTGAVLYSSCLPFHFSAGRLTKEHLLHNLLAVHQVSAEDALVNLGVYAGLAFALFAYSRKRFMDGTLVVLWCLLTSALAESAQVLIPERVSSISDFALNGVGALAGVSLAAFFPVLRRPVESAAAREWRRPWSALAVVTSSALIAYELSPFDFVTTTAELHAAFRRWHFWSDIPRSFSQIGDELPIAAWFALISFLVARDALSRRQSQVIAFGTAFQHGAILACLIECLQLFTGSHLPEIGAAVIRILAAVCGGGAAVFMTDGSSKWPCDSCNQVSTRFILAAIFIQVAFLAYGLLRLETHGVLDTSRLSWALPIRELWLQPAPLAVARIMSVLVTAGLLAATLALAMRRASWPYVRIPTTLFVMLIFTAYQFAFATLTGGSFDPTNTLLAVFACGFGLRLERFVARLDRAVISVSPSRV